MESLISPSASSLKKINLVFATDRNYLPYASVLLESILINLSPLFDYVVFLLHEGDFEGLELLAQQAKNKKNLSLHFVNLEHQLKQIKFQVHSYFSRATYFRLWLPLLFPQLERILYLDADTLLLKDPALLYQTPLHEYALAACLDLTQQLWIKQKKRLYYPYYMGTAEGYLRNYLGLEEPLRYFQAGVLLFDLHKQRKEKLFNKYLKLLTDKRTFHWLDQDILNIVFNTQGYKELDLQWNFVFHPDLALKLPQFCQVYQRASHNPAIIHYASSYKPWFYPNKPLSQLWWQVARKSPFIKEIVLRLSQEQTISKKFKREVLSLFKDESKLGIWARKIRSRFYKK